MRGVVILEFDQARAAILRLFLKSGANVGARDAEGRTPLFHAIALAEHCPEPAEILLSDDHYTFAEGVNERDNNGWSLLRHANHFDLHGLAAELRRLGAV